MLKVAITGGIACGKSALGAHLEKMGVPVCDADDLVHRLLSEDDCVRRDVAAEFGDAIIDVNNRVDRVKLAQIVFEDVSKLNLLNSILHPRVIREWSEWIRIESQKGAVDDSQRMACVIVPLLYELSLENDWDSVVCVAANTSICEERLKSKNVIEFRKRMALQYSPWDKASRSDYVVVNNGSLESLAEQWDRIYISITEKTYDK